MRWRDRTIVAFDTETTGLQPFGGDRVIEFGGVKLQLDESGDVVFREDVSFLINPGIPIPRKVTELTGISDKDVRGKPSFADVAHEISELFIDTITVAHNYPFDAAFLRRELGLAGVDWHEPMAAIDTVDVSRRVYPNERSHRLGELVKRVGVKLDNWHRATDDAAACGLAFIEMAKRADLPDDLHEMLDWANAIGRPPEGGITIDPLGVPIFAEGPHAGDRVAEHPLHLAWMTRAKVRGERGWQFRFAESTRRWAARWLEVRGSGRARSSPKSFRTTDWTLDSCIADPRAC